MTPTGLSATPDSLTATTAGTDLIDIEVIQ